MLQSSGIWSTGITSTAGKRYSSGSRDSDRSSQVYLEKPKLDLKLFYRCSLSLNLLSDVKLNVYYINL